MRVAILTIGNELTSGRIQDANASFIAREAQSRGWQVAVMLSVGDDEAAMKGALDYALPLSDAVIITGGLGPTADDMTTAAIARCFGRELYTDEEALRHVRSIFEQFRLPWTENNAKQAVFPEGAQKIFNPTGTAWGFSLAIDGKIIAVMPGVPAETRRMFPEVVIPILEKAFPEAVVSRAVRTIKVFGISEAKVDETLAGIDLKTLGVDIGFYPNFPENHIVLTARHLQADRAQENLRTAENQIIGRLGDYIFAYDQDTLEGTVAALLTQKKRTLAVAESCTGGLLTDRLTDIPGSSAFLERGIVTYSNAAKIELLGVPAEVINRYGAVSEQTARLMAEGIRRLSRTDLGIATTGIAGPSGGTAEKPVGTVFMALADGKETWCRHHAFRWDRRRNKIITSQAALLMLKRYLTGEPPHDR